MKLRTFFGLTSRSVLEQVRCELGADAMIVANRATADGIEVTAVAAGAIDSLLHSPASNAAAAPPPPLVAQATPRDEPEIKPWRPAVMSTVPASEPIGIASPVATPPVAAPVVAAAHASSD